MVRGESMEVPSSGLIERRNMRRTTLDACEKHSFILFDYLKVALWFIYLYSMLMNRKWRQKYFWIAQKELCTKLLKHSLLKTGK